MKVENTEAPQESIPKHYHLHLYFDDETAEFARMIWTRAKEQGSIESVGRFHDKPVGPHPQRQFQLRVRATELSQVEDWLDLARGSLDVLIHPEVEDDLLAHTVLARWLGRPHALHLQIFERNSH